MKNSGISSIKPEILRWARKTAGLSIVEVSTRLKRTEQEIASWEEGLSAPTYSQLEKLAYLVYKRPLAIFFLPAPPEESIPRKEFRTLPDFDFGQLAPDTYFHIRHAHAYQLVLKKLYGNNNNAKKHIWSDFQIDLSVNTQKQAVLIRQYLEIPLEKQIAWRDEDAALKHWRQVIEDAGVFVFKASFKQKDISGICLKDEQFPIIYLNNSTTKTRQIFSLLHELSHILLNVNGLSLYAAYYY